MPTQAENSFTSWKLTKDETLQGTMLSRLHKLVIQNQIARLAETKLTLKFTPDNVSDYTQQEAYLAGKLDMLQAMLLDSNEAESLFASEVATGNRQADYEEATESHSGFIVPAVEARQ